MLPQSALGTILYLDPFSQCLVEFSVDEFGQKMKQVSGCFILPNTGHDHLKNVSYLLVRCLQKFIIGSIFSVTFREDTAI